MSSEPCGKVVCNRYGRANEWERWTMEKHGDALAFKGHHGKYLTANPDGDVYCNETKVGDWELWTFVGNEDGVGNEVCIMSFHGRYLTCGEVDICDEDNWVRANTETVTEMVNQSVIFMIAFDDVSFTGETNPPPQNS